MPHVPCVPAFERCDPVTFIVLTESYNYLLH
jgi:hypothetical protein